MCATRISLCLMISAGTLLASSRRLIFGRPVIALGLTVMSLSTETYSEAKRQFSARNRDVLMNAQSPHKWWSTLKSVVFGLSSSKPPIVGGGGGLVCESVGKPDLLSVHFDGKQSRESVDMPLTCHPSPTCSPFRNDEPLIF